MVALKLTKIGNSTGVILPKEVLAEMKLEQGDSIFLTRTKDGFSVSPYAENIEQQMKVARQVMKKWRSALRTLAQ